MSQTPNAATSQASTFNPNVSTSPDTPDTASLANPQAVEPPLPQPVPRKTSHSHQPLRHGRKPIYPDSDAEADGLNADLDDEEIDTGLYTAQPDHETSSLLSSSTRNGRNRSNLQDQSWFQRAKFRISSWLGGVNAKTSRQTRRRTQRRNASSTVNPSRRNSHSLNNCRGCFAACRHDHPIIAYSFYSLLALILLAVVLFLLAASHLFVVTLSTPSAKAQSRILDESLLLKGPNRVELLNISDEGILVRVDARLGLDPDHALDLWLGKRGDQGWFNNRERKLIEWAMAKVAGVQIDVGEIRLSEMGTVWADSSIPTLPSLLPTLNRMDDSNPPQDLLSFHVHPLVLPLPPLHRNISHEHQDLGRPILGNHSTPAAHANMTPLNLTILLKPVAPSQHIFNYVKQSVESGKARLDVKISGLRVRGLADNEMHGILNKRKTSWFDIPRRIDISQKLIRSPVVEKVPKFNNQTDTRDLLQLDGYDFFEIGQDDDGKQPKTSATRALGIKAHAVAKNPLGNLVHGFIGYSLPFGVYLPIDDVAPPPRSKVAAKDNTTVASVLMAAIATEPILITGEKNISLSLMGRVVPPPKDAKPSSAHESTGYLDEQKQLVLTAPTTMAEGDTPQQLALSNFLSRFLRGDANTVYVRGGSPFPKPSAGPLPHSSQGDASEPELPGGGSVLPDWMDSALRLVDLPISFPGSKVTDLIKNVTINDLKFTPHPFEKDKLLCSGTVMGIINLPGQLSTVDVQITHLWPDILIYDGLPPSMRHGGEKTVTMSSQSVSLFHGLAFSATDDDDGETPKPQPDPAPPLPDPLPEGAFGRVRPYDFAPATTFIDPQDPKQERKLLRSELRDVPFTVLPGRGAAFRSYTWKLLMGQGVLTGIEGSSRAKIWNSGLGTLQLKNLPVKGSFVIGKRGE